MLRLSVRLMNDMGTPATNLLSMRRAPSFLHPPAESVIGKNLKDIPENWVTAYVTPEVITREEEQALLRLADPWFARLEYNDAHADGLIHHYMEFYRSYNNLTQQLRSGFTSSTVLSTSGQTEEHVGSENCTKPNLDTKDKQLVCGALERVRGLAEHYLSHIPIDDRVHFLRLKGSGFIRAHVDESRNSSGIVAGLCLNAGRVMTLTHPKHPGEVVELLLAPRCLYTLIGRARYNWEHSVDWAQDDEEHIKRIKKSLVVEGTSIYFDGKDTGLTRHTRTAIIFRGVSPMQLFASRMRLEPC
ncbi:unnamed protein product [Phytomonas sp. Hart1]|nr:unnamed protein product [Phytomonas sp. Hart1]|eukprot:CCW68570.1 unnamed protein product [Phytomonas sp. isolate Hart1]